MRDHDAAADDEGDVEGFPDLLVGDAGLDALVDVVRDAVIAAQHRRRRESQQLLRLSRERPGLVGLAIEAEEAFGDERATLSDGTIRTRSSRRSTRGVLAHDPSVHASAVSLKLFVSSHGGIPNAQTAKGLSG